MNRLEQIYRVRPVFISGFNKSGTTLLLSLLDNHPQLIVIPEELQFFKNILFQRDKREAITQRQNGFLFFLKSDGPQKNWTRGKSWFKEGYPEFNHSEFAQRVASICDRVKRDKQLLLELVYTFADVAGQDLDTKTAWVSKSTHNEIFFPLMNMMFQERLLFIYLVRDPRDVYASYQKRREIVQNSKVSPEISKFILSWRLQVNSAITYSQRFGNFMLFRFEDLLMDTERTMSSICDSLGIEYFQSLHIPTRYGKSWGGNSVFSGEFSGISAEPIGRYRTVLTSRTIRLIEHGIKKEMSSLDYVRGDASSADSARDLFTKLLFEIYRLRYRWSQKIMLWRHHFIADSIDPIRNNQQLMRTADYDRAKR